MSLCRNRNPDFEDIDDNDKTPKKDINDIKTNPVSLAQGSLRRTKKNKTRMPKDFVFNEEEEEILNQLRKKDSVLDFEDSDDNNDKKGKNHSKNKEKKEKETKFDKVEIINTDMPNLKEQNKNEDGNLINEDKKEELRNINKDENNNNDNEEEQKNKNEQKLFVNAINKEINKEDNIDKEEKVEEKEEVKEEEKVEVKEEVKDEEKEEVKEEEKEEVKEEEKEEEKEEVNENNKVDEEKVEKENIEDNEKRDIEIEKNEEKENDIKVEEKEEKEENEEKKEEEAKEEKDVKEIKEEEIDKEVKEEKVEKEEENINDENDEKEAKKEEKELKEEEDLKNEKELGKEVKEEKEEKEVKDEKEEEEFKEEIINDPSQENNNSMPNYQENNKIDNNVLFRNRPNKEEVKIEKEEEKIEKEEEKKENEKEVENEEEEEEEDDEEEKKVEQKEAQKEEIKERIIDLSKYESLIKIINIHLEGNGYSKSDVKIEIDELFKTFPDLISSDDLKSKISEILMQLMDISIDSDKTELNNFINDIIDFYKGDKNKIHEQLMKNIEGIEEQEKLTTRRSNRVIRAYIQKCKEQLNKRLKEEDIPSDKIISLEKFEKIMEETGLQFKEDHLKILLYQMKKAVPKGRNFNTLNAIVIVDFLK